MQERSAERCSRPSRRPEHATAVCNPQLVLSKDLICRCHRRVTCPHEPRFFSLAPRWQARNKSAYFTLGGTVITWA